jgi:hypothetical protein
LNIAFKYDDINLITHIGYFVVNKYMTV